VNRFAVIVGERPTSILPNKAGGYRQALGWGYCQALGFKPPFSGAKMQRMSDGECAAAR
jgi:hypothetical protein